jgi:hypothetical protein
VTYTSSTEAERLDIGLLYRPTCVAYADASLPMGVTRGGIVVGGGGVTVVGGHIVIQWCCRCNWEMTRGLDDSP